MSGSWHVSCMNMLVGNCHEHVNMLWVLWQLGPRMWEGQIREGVVPMRAWSHGSPEVGFWLHTGEVDLVQGNDSNLTVKR